MSKDEKRCRGRACREYYEAPTLRVSGCRADNETPTPEAKEDTKEEED